MPLTLNVTFIGKGETPSTYQDICPARARTSLPVRTASGSSQNVPSSAVRGARPMTTGAAAVNDRSGVTRQRGAVPPAPIADGTSWACSIRSYNPSDKARENGKPMGRQRPVTADLSLSPTMFRGAYSSEGHYGEKESKELFWRRSQHNERDRERDERLVLLATACLLACLGRRCRLNKAPGPQGFGRENKRKSSRSDSIDQDSSFKTLDAAWAATATAAVQLHGITPPAGQTAATSLPSRAHHKKYTRRGSTSGDNKTHPRKLPKPGIKRFMSRRGETKPATVTSSVQEATKDYNSICGDSAGRDNHNTTGVSERQSRRSDRNSGNDQLLQQRQLHDWRGVGVTAVYTELERLGAVAKAPELLSAPCPLHQELGVGILVHGLEESTKKWNHPDMR